MNVLGISGRYRDAAAALAIDGQVAAAASEDGFARVAGVGYAYTGGFPAAAVEACLAKVGLEIGDVDRIGIINDEGVSSATPVELSLEGWLAPKTTTTTIDPVHGDAVQMAACAPDVNAVLVCSTHPPVVATFVREGPRLVETNRLSAEPMMSAARSLAATLGVATADPFLSLDRLSVGGEAEFADEMTATVSWSPAAGVSVDSGRLDRLIASSAGGEVRGLSQATSLNSRIQDARRSLAASFVLSLAHVVGDASKAAIGKARSSMLGLSGGMCANPRFATELRRFAGDEIRRAAVPECAGRALGAALSGEVNLAARLSGLDLGPTFTDYDIKRTLDNCRLDYVYEPDWRRLIHRVSAMLSQGKVIAWFQGALAFGPRPLGSRSVLCDPSGRYARQNINEYLRRAPLDEPLPVTFAPSSVQRCLTGHQPAEPTVVDAEIGSEWEERLVSALDWRRRVRVQALGAEQAPALCELLERHLERTGVPALIEVPLAGPGEPVACTPRDAVRTVYSSAIDALVIGRFLLMKDYWLLRSDDV